MLNALLQVMDSNPQILDVISDYPPPFYTCAYYTDWVQDYISAFISECQKNFIEGITNQKITIGEETLKLMKSVQGKIDSKVKKFLEDDVKIGAIEQVN